MCSCVVGGDPIGPGAFPQEYDDFPAVSGDGGRIIYRSIGDSKSGIGLYMMDTTGNPIDFFVPGGYHPEWGPGDTILYYTSQFDDHLGVLNLNSGEEISFSDSTEDRRAHYNELANVVYFDRYNRHTAPYHDIFALDPSSLQITKIVRGKAPWSVGDPPQIAYEWAVYPTPTTYYEALFILNTGDMTIDTLPIRSDYLNDPVLSPNVEVVYYGELKRGLSPRLMAFDRLTKQVRTLVTNAREPHLDNVGKVLYYVAPDDAYIERIWKLDLSSGARTQLTY